MNEDSGSDDISGRAIRECGNELVTPLMIIRIHLLIKIPTISLVPRKFVEGSKHLPVLKIGSMEASYGVHTSQASRTMCELKMFMLYSA